MRVRIPEDISSGSDLKVIPPGPYTAAIKDVIVKAAKTSGAPKAVVRWLLTSEPEGGAAEFPTVGETVLDTYSLQEQALWRLNDLHKALTGQNIPAEDYDMKDFEVYLNSVFPGQDATLMLVTEPDNKGNDRTKVESVSK